MVYVFAFAIVCIISFTIYRGLVDNGFFTIVYNQSHGAFNVTQLQENADTTYDLLDFMVLFVFIGSTIAALIGAILIRSHPAFFFISIIVMMVQIFVAMALSNTWDAMINNANFADAKAQFTTANFVLGNLPVFILIAVILLAVVLYALNPLGVD
jgi:glucan phosphoethanolaminetransferase (alkaline phosphatase superfamily)